MKKLICFLSFLLFILAPLSTKAADEPTPIYDVAGLKAMAENNTGSYILMQDLDLAGVSWTPIDFYGSFDGNGHTLLNLKVNSVSAETRIGFDGNRKEYDTHFGGFFGIMENATVRNLNFLGASVIFEADSHTFLGILAGYTRQCTITGCSIRGTVQLRCSAKLHGVAGISGYCGFNNDLIEVTTFENNTVDVTLINVDTNKEEKDEEFLGGITCIGYPEVKNCTVKIDGYISDHGYVHSGGVIGLYLKPLNRKKDYVGYLTDITVSGRIKFFEDNNDPRGYCNGVIGEMLNRCDNMTGNDTSGFTPLQLRKYDRDLYPHECKAGDEYMLDVIPSTCTDFGYSVTTCIDCKYKHKLAYTLKAHQPSEVQEVITESTFEKPGLAKTVCTACNEIIYVSLPVLTPTPLPTPTQEPTPSPEPTAGPTPTVTESATGPEPTAPARSETSGRSGIILLLVAVPALLLISGGCLVHFKLEKERKARRRIK